MSKKRLVGMLFAIAVVVGLLPTLASAADPIFTDVVIHKMNVQTGTGLADHDGEEITDFTGTNLDGATPISGIIFKYWSISSTATPAQISAIMGLTTIEECEIYAASNPTVLTAGTNTAATDTNGVVRVNGLAEGRYLFAEVNGASHNVYGYVGVPFVLELPAMKVDGTAYFGTGADALHVYPKNVLRSPGLDVETRSEEGTTIPTPGARIGSSSFDVYQKNASGVYVLVGTLGAGTGRIILPTGVITLADLESGEYQLINVAAPSGYLIDDREIYFEVSAGTITFDATGSNPESYFTAGTTATNDMITLLLRREPGGGVKTVDDELEATYQVGYAFNYNVTITLPSDIVEYDQFDMTDELDTQLSWAGTDNQGDVVVMAGTTTLTLGTHYTKSVVGKILTLTFNPANLGTFAGQELSITYKVKINETAVLGMDLENNVTFDYDNGHGGTGTKKPPPPVVWTGGAKFVKVDSSNTGNFLPGAEFKIATDATGTTFLVWTADLIAINTYGSFVTPVVGADIIMRSNTLGQFEIQGLKGGTYYLVETKAPTVGGTTYNLLRDPAAFTVTKTSYDAAQPITILNNAGIRIPQTGGIGTAIFSVIGLSLMGIAVFMFRKRRNSQG